MSLRAGLLNESIDILRATITKNAFGEDVETWTTNYTTRARVIQQSSSKQDENQETVVRFVREFQVRHYVPVDEFDIILWREKRYRIISLNNDRANMYITIEGELINE